MDPRRKSSLLWGAIGGLSFLVLLQSYHLFVGEFIGVGPMAVGAVLVSVASSLVTHHLRPRLAPRNERP
jgi:hypothetical protein